MAAKKTQAKTVVKKAIAAAVRELVKAQDHLEQVKKTVNNQV